MALWRLYYHLVWTTKERQPLITPTRERELYGYIIGKSDTLNCILHAIGGIEDHLHLIVSIPPTLSIADFVQTIKGGSAYHLNHLSLSPDKFGWQNGYGVFSLGAKQLETAVNYVQHQTEHHQNQTTIAALENITDKNDPPNRWQPK
jgi:putative transposase